jgi:hypothetical protein
MNDQLLIGIVLIGIGILLAALAYMFLGNREPQGGQAASSKDEDGDGESVMAPGIPSPDSTPDEPSPKPQPEDMEPPHSSASTEPGKADPASPIHKTPEPARGERIQVAMLLRDEVSGKLIVKIDDVEYEDREALKESRHWTRVEYAARDLSQWVEVIERKTSVHVEREIEVPDVKPKSMIEQIDQILQDRIEARNRPDLAVRLTEGPGGTARVLIGVNSYEIADVPDPEIKTLIREAVATWEATQ